jgi:hypothetical protein
VRDPALLDPRAAPLQVLDSLDLPIKISESRVGLLQMTIPWHALGSQPVKVTLQDVSLLIAPLDFACCPDEQQRFHARAMKMRKLLAAEELWEQKQAQEQEDDQPAGSSFLERLTSRILDNIQLTVHRLHVRFEDVVSDPSRPCAVGINLEEFSVLTTDRNGNAAFLDRSRGVSEPAATVVHKSLAVKSLSVYWDHDLTPEQLFCHTPGSFSAYVTGKSVQVIQQAVPLLLFMFNRRCLVGRRQRTSIFCARFPSHCCFRLTCRQKISPLPSMLRRCALVHWIWCSLKSNCKGLLRFNAGFPAINKCCSSIPPVKSFDRFGPMCAFAMHRKSGGVTHLKLCV